MLLDLEIRDFAIIDELSIQFGPGLNALTGETGAGKSIIIDALGAVLGERASAEMVRSGAKTAYVDARFQLDSAGENSSLMEALEEHGIDAVGGELILSREIQAGGRSSARVNGRSITAALLGLLGQLLVDIHGQSDHLSLLRPAAQLSILDRYGKLEGERAAVAESVRAWRAANARLESFDSGARDRAQRIDLLRYQVEEIEGAGLRPGEDAELEIERDRLANAERLGQLVAMAAGQVSGDDPEAAAAVDALHAATRTLGDAAALDASLLSLNERLLEATVLVDEIALELRDYLSEIEANPERLEVVQERLEAIKQLKRKYGPTIEAIVAYGEQASSELEELTGSDLDESSLREQVGQLRQQALERAAVLTRSRTDAAERLARDASLAAADLNLGTMMFSIAVRPRTGVAPFDETGADLVEFMFSPNTGEAPKSLARVASGGETARMMLALKSVLADSDRTPTLVFDEVDVGIGGRSGQMVGVKLQQLSGGHQVVVITHLPQIAAVADSHFKIAKDARDGRTTSRVTLMEGDQRVDEIASMIDGEPPSATSRKGAREMLERAGHLV